MTDKLYRFYDRRGKLKWYLKSDCQTYTTYPDQAGAFTERDWQLWGMGDFEREVVCHDQPQERESQTPAA